MNILKKAEKYKKRRYQHTMRYQQINHGKKQRILRGKRMNYWYPTMRQRWSIPLPMLSPMGGGTLQMMSIFSIGWREIALYLLLCLIRNCWISWLCTWKVGLVHGIWGARLWSLNNHGLNKIWRLFSLFFNLIYCAVIVTLQRKWQINLPSVSIA